MTDKNTITDPMEVLLNPEHLKKLREEHGEQNNNPQDAIYEVQDYVPEVVKEELEKQEHKLDNEIVQNIIFHL